MNEAILLRVVIPHPFKIFRTDDERLERMRRLLKDAGERRSHQRLAETDHITEYDAAAPFEVACGDAHRSRLKFQQHPAHVGRNTERCDALARFLGEVIRHLDVNVIWRYQRRTGPAFLNDLNQLFGDVDTPAVVPAALEPGRQLHSSIFLDHIHVQLTLIAEAGAGQIA